MNKSLLYSVIVLFVSTILQVGSVTADDWGHWRGPTGNGVATNATPPTEWTDTKNVKWKVEIPGKGSGSPVVWKDQVFVVTAVPANAPNESDQAAPADNQPASGRRGRSRPGRGGGELQKLQFKILCFNRKTGELECPCLCWVSPCSSYP